MIGKSFLRQISVCSQYLLIPLTRFPGKKFSIFSRLVFGYMAIFVLFIIMSLYTIISMGEFSELTHSVLLTDNRITDQVGKLADTLLSQVRYERKFVITGDPAFYGEFVHLESAFNQYADEAIRVADSSQVKSSLKNIKEFYRTYQALVFEELNRVKSRLPYLQEWYKGEKERTVNELIKEIEKVKLYNQQNIIKKMESLYQAGAHTRVMAMWMTGGFLVFSIILSFFIQRSITQPISIMKKKTREIARGHFDFDLDLSSPPEVGELARDFRDMCNKLKELDKMKSDFFFSMSHDLRTPLTTIKMGVQLLSKSPEEIVPDRRRKVVAILSEEIGRMIHVVDSLLDLAKMEAGMMTYTLEEKDLSPLIDRALIELSPLAEAKKIGLEKQNSETLPALKIDSERILQVLRNLMGNAVKFTSQGGRVSVSARPTDGGVEVAVTDTGAGIPPENLCTIFEKFQQGSPQGGSHVKGTGLGLALVKEIVTSHGGKVWAESKPGQGSTFFFVLPS